MTRRYFNDLDSYAESDIVIVVPVLVDSALPTCSARLVPISDCNHRGFCISRRRGLAWWSLFSAMVMRKPADAFLTDLGVPFEDEGDFVVVSMP